MFTFVYNSLGDAYNNEEPSAKYYFKSRNIATPAPSLFNVTKSGFSSTNKKIEDLEDDISPSQQYQIE